MCRQPSVTTVMVSVRRAALAICLALMVLVPGCVERGELIEATPFPEFTLDDGLSNTTFSKEANLGEAWVAYFSASWCGHCYPTLDAIDLVIPNGSLLVFNKDGTNEQYSDMVEWHEKMEDEVGRDLYRPFIHGPELASEVGVGGIPYVVFVDANGNIVTDHLGLWTNMEEMSAIWNQTLAI